MTSKLPKSQARVRPGIVMTIVVLFELAILIWMSFGKISSGNTPNYMWPLGLKELPSTQPGDVTCDFYLTPVSLDTKSEILYVSDLSTNFWTLTPPIENKTNQACMLFKPYHDDSVISRPPPFSNGTLDWKGSDRIMRFGPYTESGGPVKGYLEYHDEYPWDSYSMTFIFGLNGSLNFKYFLSRIALTPTFGNDWAITQLFEKITDHRTLNASLNGLGFSPASIYSSLVHDYSDFYQFKISLSRNPLQMERAVLAFWVPAIGILDLLGIAFWKHKVLGVSGSLTLFTGIGMSILILIVGSRDILPPRLTLLEILFYLEIVCMIALAAWHLIRE